MVPEEKKISLDHSRSAKDTFSLLFIILVIFLMIFPFFRTFEEFMTRIVEITGFYQPIKTYIVPYEISLVRKILFLSGIQTLPDSVSYYKNGDLQNMFIAWNCIGWQSVIIVIFSLKAGLTRNFTNWSRLQAVLIGIFGTFLMNLFRIAFVIILFYYWGELPAMIFHDYLSLFLTIAWLFFFWWFVYNFVLEEV